MHERSVQGICKHGHACDGSNDLHGACSDQHGMKHELQNGMYGDLWNMSISNSCMHKAQYIKA